MKMVYYQIVKITIDTARLTKIIIDVMVKQYSLPDSIVTNRGFLLTLKLWLLLYYFFGIKRRLLIAFHLQINIQTEQQKNIIDSYFQAFVNLKPENLAKLLLIAEFAYNNTKNASTGCMLFELNCDYYPSMSYKEDIDLCFKLNRVEILWSKLHEHINVCQKNLYHTQKL